MSDEYEPTKVDKMIFNQGYGAGFVAGVVSVVVGILIAVCLIKHL